MSASVTVSKSMFALARQDEAFQIVREEYLDSASENIAHFFRRYESHHDQMKIDSVCIGETTFRALIELTIDPIEKVYRKFGKSEARKAAREVESKFCYRGAYFQAQNDVLHTPLALAHPVTRKYFGTPKNYFSITPMFRGIRGNIVDSSGRGENSSLMIELIKRSVLPKNNIDKQYGILEKNPFWGMQIEEVFDPGPGANARNLLNFAAQFHIGIRLNQTATPWSNPHIERFNDTYVRKFISTLPGYMPGKRNSDGGKLNLNKMAFIDPFQYEVISEKILSQYHGSGHSGLFGSTPIEAYRAYLENPSSILMASPQLPNDVEAFQEYCVPWLREVTIQAHQGIQIDNRFYGSPDTTTRIGKYLKQRKRKAQFFPYIDHNDFGYIKIPDPENGSLVRVPFRKYSNHIDDAQKFDPGVSTMRVEMLEKHRVMSIEQIVEEAIRMKKDVARKLEFKMKTSTPVPIGYGELRHDHAELALKSVLDHSLIPIPCQQDEVSFSSIDALRNEDDETKAAIAELEKIFGVAE